ncbi:MAG: type II secretion system protein [Rhodocyclaceae bacterium]|nr:MAG: type II secretion system protein [Rhodocyclaceae bacterium]
MARNADGFTLIELVMIMVVISILAVVALPRMQTDIYRALEFHDKTVAALRYAQKTATSHRRMVCVDFTASTVTLTIDHDRSGSCNGQALNIVGGSSNVVQSGDPANAVFSPVPASFNFLSDGTGSDRSLSITGQPVISVVGTTGSVY